MIAHFESLGSGFCEQITDVSCDYWKGYIGVAQHCFPTATIVLDRFHVTNLLNSCVDTFGKLLRKSEVDNLNYRRLKWVLYKQYHNLSDKELTNLQLCFKDCPLLKEVYWKREEFHPILDNNQEVEVVVQKIEQWVENMNQELKNIFKSFTTTLNNTKR